MVADGVIVAVFVAETDRELVAEGETVVVRVPVAETVDVRVRVALGVRVREVETVAVRVRVAEGVRVRETVALGVDDATMAVISLLVWSVRYNTPLSRLAVTECVPEGRVTVTDHVEDVTVKPGETEEDIAVYVAPLTTTVKVSAAMLNRTLPYVPPMVCGILAVIVALVTVGGVRVTGDPNVPSDPPKMIAYSRSQADAEVKPTRNRISSVELPNDATNAQVFSNSGPAVLTDLPVNRVIAPAVAGAGVNCVLPDTVMLE